VDGVPQPLDKLRVTRRKRGGKCTAEVFKDGVNAGRNATDYKKQTITVSPSDKLTVHLPPAQPRLQG